jgi:hypothetical protein
MPPDIGAKTSLFKDSLSPKGPSRNFFGAGNRVRALLSQTPGRRAPMHVNIIMIQPLIALLFGILILILPRLLNYLIAIYLIFIGLVGLFPHLFTAAT